MGSMGCASAPGSVRSPDARNAMASNNVCRNISGQLTRERNLLPQVFFDGTFFFVLDGHQSTEMELVQLLHHFKLLGAGNITGDATGGPLLKRIDKGCTQAERSLPSSRPNSDRPRSLLCWDPRCPDCWASCPSASYTRCACLSAAPWAPPGCTRAANASYSAARGGSFATRRSDTRCGIRNPCRARACADAGRPALRWRLPRIRRPRGNSGPPAES